MYMYLDSLFVLLFRLLFGAVFSLLGGIHALRVSVAVKSA